MDQELFLPEPAPRDVRVTVISVDDHVVEPPDTFEGRLPAALAARAPVVVETAEGHQVWEFEGQRFTQVGMNAVAGRRPETYSLEPFRFDQMRPGCYEIEARVRDMDINGVWASLNFPSQISGFCGRVFFTARDRELGLACIRAWNDWLFEDWYSAHPDRIIPLGITYLSDAGGGGGRDPAQRRAGLHLGHPARAAARDRAPVAVGPRALGPHHRGHRGDRHGGLAARGQLGDAQGAAGRTGPADRRHPVRPAVAPGLHRVALVGLSRCGSRT